MATWIELTDSFNNDQQIEEMKKKYENCYLFVKTSGKEPFLCKYMGWNGEFHMFKDPYDMDLRLRHNTETEVVCAHPDKGLFNAGARMYYYSKLPNRQYKRGMCKDNCSIIDPVLGLWGQTSNCFNGTLLNFTFKSEFPDIITAIALLRKRDAASVAISRDFGLSQSVTKSKGIFLWYHDTCIGHVYEDDTISVKNPFFEQEVMDNIKLFQGLKVEFNAK